MRGVAKPCRGHTPAAFRALRMAFLIRNASWKSSVNRPYTIAIVLLVLWLLGLVTATTLGGFIHVLLVIAIVMVLLRVIQGRGPL